MTSVWRWAHTIRVYPQQMQKEDDLSLLQFGVKGFVRLSFGKELGSLVKNPFIQNGSVGTTAKILPMRWIR